MRKTKVAIIGTVGLPANYGGFETLVENIIGENCSPTIEYTVFCSSKNNYGHKLKHYKGACLKYIGFKANGFQSILYDVISILRSLRKYEVLLILGVSGAIVLPFIKWMCRGKIVINVDGLEHRREKWSNIVRKFLKLSEKIAVLYADVVISDNKAIQDYIKNEYGKDSSLIAYGGDHVICDTFGIEDDILTKYGVCKNGYTMSLCRIEPENNVHLILDAFIGSNRKLLFIGNWDNSNYGRQLKAKLLFNDNIRMLSPIYDLQTLNVLRSNCDLYIHGHSAGGTNPSLVEIMFFAKPILAFDCIYNRESTENKADYFADTKELVALLAKSSIEFNTNAESMLEIATRGYLWTTIAKQYESLY